MVWSVRKYFTDRNEDLSLLRVFRPVYVTLAIFGLFPYCIKFKIKHMCIIIPQTIYLNCLCAAMMITPIFVFAGIDVQIQIDAIAMGHGAKIPEFNYIIEAVFVIACSLSGYICVYFYRNKIVKILNEMACTWINLIVTRNRILEKLRSQIIFSLIVLLFLLITHMLITFTLKTTYWKKIVITFDFILPQIIHFVILTFYCVLVFMLVALLSNIEEVIKTSQVTELTVGNSRKFKPWGAKVRMQSLELICVRVFKIKRDLNNSFQATLLLTCIQCFHSLVGEGHLIYHGVIVTGKITNGQLIFYSAWIIYQLMKIYALAYSGSLYNVMVCRIGQALHKITHKDHDIRALLEIQHFSSLLSFQATDLTVYGYFSLDASLFFKIAASATTYLIISVQFDRKH